MLYIVEINNIDSFHPAWYCNFFKQHHDNFTTMATYWYPFLRGCNRRETEIFQGSSQVRLVQLKYC